MPFLIAALVLVAVLCLVDLMLTFGVIRRLREHTTTLEGLVRRGPVGGRAGVSTMSGLPAPQSTIGEFAASTVDGEPISPDLFVEDTIVVFLAPECAECRQKVPALVKLAGQQDRRRTLVVLDGSLSDAADMVGPLSPVATVVVGTSATSIINAFGINAFPSFCLVGEGKVVVASVDFTQLPVAVRA